MLKDRKAKALDAELKTMDAQKQKLQVDYNLMSNQYSEEKEKVAELLEIRDQLINEVQRDKKALFEELGD